jgi:hypothetical protein
MENENERVPQHVQWTGWMDTFMNSGAWNTLTSERQQFVLTFRARLADKKSLSKGDRTGVVSPFANALAELLGNHGATIYPVKYVQIIPYVKKKADLIFSIGMTRWVVEIKTGLEFNSLGAAVLEAVALRKVEPTSKYMLVGLYSKDSAGHHPHEVLAHCGMGRVFDFIAVLSQNRIKGDSWNYNFAEGLNSFLDRLPVPD